MTSTNFATSINGVPPGGLVDPAGDVVPMAGDVNGYTKILPMGATNSIVIQPSGADLTVSAVTGYNADTYRSTYVGGTGNIIGILVGDGTTQRTWAVTAGQFLPLIFSKIIYTGTTATGLLAVG